MVDPSRSPHKGKRQESPTSTTHDAHDITSLSDLPARRMKTKLWPMSPIESLTAEEVMAIADRDHTPVLIAVLDGDDTGEKYLCSNKRGATLPPEIAAEGSWAQKYYQQVVALNNSLKEMQANFEPVWRLVKEQQMMLITVELFDGLLVVANRGLQDSFQRWDNDDKKSIITSNCDIRSPRQVNYFSVLKNYTRGGFNSLDTEKFQWVQDLLLEGENYLTNHAHNHGFQCPSDIRALIQEFLRVKRDRNVCAHPLTLAKQVVAFDVIQNLKSAIMNDELPRFKSTKSLILLGAEYAESMLKAYGKFREVLFLDPKGRGKNRPTISPNEQENDSPEDSPRASSPLSLYSPANQLFGQDFQVGQSSRSPSSPPFPPSNQRPTSSPPSSPQYYLNPGQPRSSSPTCPPFFLNQPRSSPPSSAEYPQSPQQPMSSPPASPLYPPSPLHQRSSQSPPQPMSSPPASPQYPPSPLYQRSSQSPPQISQNPKDSSQGSPPISTHTHDQQLPYQTPHKRSSQSPPPSSLTSKPLSAESPPFIPGSRDSQQPPNLLKRPSGDQIPEPSQSPQNTLGSPVSSPSPGSSANSGSSPGSQSSKTQHSAQSKKQKLAGRWVKKT